MARRRHQVSPNIIGIEAGTDSLQSTTNSCPPVYVATDVKGALLSLLCKVITAGAPTTSLVPSKTHWTATSPVPVSTLNGVDRNPKACMVTSSSPLADP
jgi:hypothetical protein